MYYEELSELSPFTELSIGEVIKHIKIWMSAKHQADQQQILRIYAVFHVRKTIFIAYMNAKGTLIVIYRTFSLVREFQRNLSSHECSGIIGVRSGIFIKFMLDKHSVNLRVCQAHRDFFGLSWRWNRASCGYGHNVSSKAKADQSLIVQARLKFRQTLQYKLQQVCGNYILW